MDYRSIIESRYNRQNWQELLYDIFHQRVQFWQQPQLVPVDESMAKRALFTGKITLPDGHIIAIYEVELSDSVIIERNRAGIRNLLCTNWRGMGCSGAFMFCFRQNEAVLRFSYVSEAFTFTEDGGIKKESTDTKRFTYLLGEGHRSRTAIQQFEKLKASGLTLKDVTKAFSVEALSKMFFDEYKKQYEDIIEFITGKRMVKVANKWEERVTGQPCSEIMQEFAKFEDAEKAVRDYVKKLMGRLVFIQFLQKKGWMGCSAGEAWNDGDREFVQNLFANTTHKNTFVDDVLEPLFADINTKRTGDIASSPNVGTGIKIPYLNGGLFEHDDYDKTAFPLPAKYMKSLLDFFASYNFTIDENDPDDAEIGVDPEMLGRIFENLLEDNKDKGAFYTPKEIVQYMCRESLIAYLQTDVEDDAVKLHIREFVITNNADLLSADLAASIDQKLKDVKICDPAIGSGAFPMGLLRELYACRKAIEGIDNDNAVRIKTHIIQNNIYGVDIEKGAVDIARLRFWLALIVDEKTPHALPNMDFKIMQGNSLLEQYEGVELSGMSLNEQEKRRSRKKKEQAWQQTLAFDEESALDNIQHAIKEYYLTDDHNAKLSLRSIINENVRSYIINLKGCTAEVQKKIEKLPIPNDKFFLWHIYFKEVFDKGGFDIVIGNPPYIQLQANEGALANLYEPFKFKTFDRMGDIYSLFYEYGNSLLKTKGVLCYITSNKWMRTGYGEKTRLFFKDDVCPRLLVDFVRMKLFDDATVETNILLFTNENYDVPTKCSAVVELKKNELDKLTSIINDNTYINVFDNSDFWVLSLPIVGQLKTKIKSSGQTLKEWGVKVNFGVKTGFNDAFVITGDKRNEILSACTSKQELERTQALIAPVIRGRDVQTYQNPKSDLWLICTFPSRQYDIEMYPAIKNFILSFGMERVEQTGIKRIINGQEVKARKKTKHKWFETQDPIAYWEDLAKPKIVWKRIGSILRFSYDEDKSMCLDSTCFATGKLVKFLCALFNSKLGHFLLQDSPKTGTGDLLVSVQAIEPIHVPMPDDKQRTKIENAVDRILSAKKTNPQADTTTLENEIDKIVYHLYSLTYDEVLVIDPETPITREEYSNFQLN